MGYVYRYTDKADGIIKYVGIVWSENRTLSRRIQEHKNNDKWCKGKAWKIEYLERPIKSRTDAEYVEAHYISLFNTGVWYNNSKVGWGISEFLPKNDCWVEYAGSEKAKEEKIYDKLTEIISEQTEKINRLQSTINILQTKIHDNETPLVVHNHSLPIAETPNVQMLQRQNCARYKSEDIIKVLHKYPESGLVFNACLFSDTGECVSQVDVEAIADNVVITTNNKSATGDDFVKTEYKIRCDDKIPQYCIGMFNIDIAMGCVCSDETAMNRLLDELEMQETMYKALSNHCRLL